MVTRRRGRAGLSGACQGGASCLSGRRVSCCGCHRSRSRHSTEGKDAEGWGCETSVQHTALITDPASHRGAVGWDGTQGGEKSHSRHSTEVPQAPQHKARTPRDGTAHKEARRLARCGLARCGCCTVWAGTVWVLHGVGVARCGLARCGRVASHTVQRVGTAAARREETA